MRSALLSRALVFLCFPFSFIPPLVFDVSAWWACLTRQPKMKCDRTSSSEGRDALDFLLIIHRALLVQGGSRFDMTIPSTLSLQVCASVISVYLLSVFLKKTVLLFFSHLFNSFLLSSRFLNSFSLIFSSSFFLGLSVSES